MTDLKPLDFVLVRDAGPRDENFIFHSWLRSFRKSPTTLFVEDEAYYKGQHKVVEDTINSVIVKVAYHAEDPSHILGYIAYEYSDENKAIVHWLFVKRDYRGFGIGQMLWKIATDDAQRILYTHTNAKFEKVKNKEKCVYDPYKRIGVRI